MKDQILNDRLVYRVENIVKKNTPSYNIDFLCDNNKYNFNKEQLIKTFINFFPLTQAFALNSFAYTSTISECILNNNKNGIVEEKKLELFLAKVIEITVVEFNLKNVISPQNFHYNAFLRLGKKLGIDTDKLKNNQYPFEPETKILVENIQTNFHKKNLMPGLANIFVIESCALNIINSLWNAFTNLKDQDGNQLYNEYELEHITEHQIIEIVHNAEAHDLLELITPSEQNFQKLSDLVEELSLNLGNYWNTLLPV